MDGELQVRFEVPPPKTNTPDFKFMYACQRIFQKIEKNNNLLFTPELNLEQPRPHREVDLKSEQEYIRNEVLLPQKSPNEFRIEERSLPKYYKM